MNGQLPKVAFILVCWNNQDLLVECVETIAAQNYTNHVTIMIDNGSKDDSVSLVREGYPWVEVIEAGVNLGFAKGNNHAIAHVLQHHPDIAYLVFLNTDARLDSGWLSTLVLFAEQKPKGALFQSTTLDYYNHAVVDSTHIYISHNGSGTQASWRTPFMGFKGPRKVFGVNAAAAMISRSFVDAQPFANLFDETMFMYLEDVDLSARATVIGWDNYLVPGTFAYHMGSASSGKKPGFSLYMTYRNNLALLAKNIPLPMLIRMGPDMVRSDYHTIRHLRRIGQADVVPKLIKGRFIGLVRLPLYTSSIIRMHTYRKSVCKSYLWQLMHHGE
ncbi:MAG: glycosyltransferase family 2 protein [Cytophaga sp.]|nr:glycosyltransferase family 2 protein [Undibacterium sp.]